MLQKRVATDMQKHNAKKARNEREEGNGKKKGEKSEKEKGDKKTESKTDSKSDPRPDSKSDSKSGSKSEDEDEGFQKVERKKGKPVARGSGSQGPRRPVETNHQCDLCGEKHWLSDCQKFRAKGAEDRMTFCEEKKLCFKCLRWPHETRDCRWIAKCWDCGKAHNSLLHGTKRMEEFEKERLKADQQSE